MLKEHRARASLNGCYCDEWWYTLSWNGGNFGRGVVFEWHEKGCWFFTRKSYEGPSWMAPMMPPLSARSNPDCCKQIIRNTWFPLCDFQTNALDFLITFACLWGTYWHTTTNHSCCKSKTPGDPLPSCTFNHIIELFQSPITTALWRIAPSERNLAFWLHGDPHQLCWRAQERVDMLVESLIVIIIIEKWIGSPSVVYEPGILVSFVDFWQCDDEQPITTYSTWNWRGYDWLTTVYCNEGIG